MRSRSLNSRREQLALLTSACQSRAVAVLSRAGSPADAWPGQLVALERDGLLAHCDWEPNGPLNVDVTFEHNGLSYGFRSHVHHGGCGPTGQCWRLAVPLAVEPEQRRATFRRRFNEETALRADLTPVDQPGRTIPARLTDLSSGGLGCITRCATLDSLSVGQLSWIVFDLDRDTHPFEFIVRLVHQRRTPDNRIVTGWAYQPADDPGQLMQQLQRLDRAVTATCPSLEHPDSLRGTNDGTGT